MWGTLGYSLQSVRLARLLSYGRELYVILVLLLGCGVTALGDKVFHRRVGTWLRFLREASGVSQQRLAGVAIAHRTVRYSNQPHTLQEASTRVYPTPMALLRMVRFRRAASNTSSHTWRDAVGELSLNVRELTLVCYPLT